MSDKLGFDPEALEAVKARFADLRRPPKKDRAPRRKSTLETRRKREDRAIHHGDMRRISGRPNTFVQLNIKTSPEAKERFATQVLKRSKQMKTRVYNWEHLDMLMDLWEDVLAKETEQKTIS